MRTSKNRPVGLWGTLAMLLGVTAGLASAAMAQAVSGKAYGALVRGPLGTQQSATAVLPAVAVEDGAMADDAADAMSVPGTLTTEGLTGTTSGAIDDVA